MERTLILIKPDGVQRGLMGQIIDRFERRGLKLVGMKFVQISPELASEHYAVHRERPFYSGLVAYIISSPVVAMVWEGKNAIAAATSCGSEILPNGISLIMSCLASSKVIPFFSALVLMIDSNRPVIVAPGNTLFTVMPNGPNSSDNVFDQLATAPRMVLETPNPRNGTFTEVEMILMMRPYFSFFILGVTAWTKI